MTPTPMTRLDFVKVSPISFPIGKVERREFPKTNCFSVGLHIQSFQAGLSNVASIKHAKKTQGVMKRQTETHVVGDRVTISTADILQKKLFVTPHHRDCGFDFAGGPCL